MFKIKGYTLIELLVVMGIFALLFSFSFAAYTNFNKNRSLENGAREVEAVLRDAQHRAITGEYDQTEFVNHSNDNDDCYKLINWQVIWGTPNNSYRLIGVCASKNNPGPPPATRTYKTFTTKTMTLSSVGTVQFSNTGSVTFNPFLGGVSSTASVCIHFVGVTNNYYKITVTAGGSVDVTKGSSCP